MKTVYREVKVGKKSLSLELDEGKAKVVWNGQTFDRLDNLVKRLPEMGNPRFVEPFAIVANFLFSGLRYEVIEDISHFCANYKRLLKENAEAADYSVFDVSVIKKPIVEGTQAMIYVEELSTGLPFKLICPYPYTDHRVPFRYALLPYL